MKKLLLIIPPPPKSVYRIHDPKGLSMSTQLRVGLSKQNFHKFQHNFRDTLNPLCIINHGIEDTEHYFLLCYAYDADTISAKSLGTLEALLRLFM